MNPEQGNAGSTPARSRRDRTNRIRLATGDRLEELCHWLDDRPVRAVLLRESGLDGLFAEKHRWNMRCGQRALRHVAPTLALAARMLGLDNGIDRPHLREGSAENREEDPRKVFHCAGEGVPGTRRAGKRIFHFRQLALCKNQEMHRPVRRFLGVFWWLSGPGRAARVGPHRQGEPRPVNGLRAHPEVALHQSRCRQPPRHARRLGSTGARRRAGPTARVEKASR